MNKAIKKIELDLGGKVVSLTPEQAKNLKDALDDLFGERVIREIVREKEYVPQPYLLPYYTHYWEWYQPTYGTYVYDHVTCDGVGNYTYSGTLKLTG